LKKHEAKLILPDDDFIFWTHRGVYWVCD